MQEYDKSIKYSFLCKLEYFNKHTNKVIPMCNVQCNAKKNLLYDSEKKKRTNIKF